MSGIKKATFIQSVDWHRESEHLANELLEETMKDPWDLAMLVEKLNSSNWFCEVAEA